MQVGLIIVAIGIAILFVISAIWLLWKGLEPIIDDGYHGELNSWVGVCIIALDLVYVGGAIFLVSWLYTIIRPAQ